MRIQDFEKSLAYTYGIEDNEAILSEYMAGSEAMQNSPDQSKKQLQGLMEPHFKNCYTIIQQNLGLSFDINKAALLEFELFWAIKTKQDNDCILAQSRLYLHVLGGDIEDYKPASTMRVKLYKKFRRLEQDGIEELTAAQKQQFQNDADVSAGILNKLVKRAQVQAAAAQYQQVAEKESEVLRVKPS